MPQRTSNTTRSHTTSTFKSAEGRTRILAHYDRLLAKVDFNYRERYVNTRFGATYILESGEESLPPLILLHGSTSNSAAWFGDIKTLSVDFRVFSIDLIGDAGHSAETRPDVKSDGYAMWLYDVFEQLNLTKSFIMGISLGAWIAVKFASCFPEKTDKLAILAASGIAPIRLAFIVRVLLYGMSGGMGKKAIERMVFGKDLIPKDARDFMTTITQNYRPYTGALPVFSNAELRRLTMPLLYIGGEEDALTHVPESAKRLRKFVPNSTTCVLENRGHVVMAVLDKVVPFFKKAKSDLYDTADMNTNDATS
jgi:pimeloyl-ACP methyl ester carboxylesterase